MSMFGLLVISPLLVWLLTIIGVLFNIFLSKFDFLLKPLSIVTKTGLYHGL